MGYQQAHTDNSMEIDLQRNNMEVDQSALVLAEVMTPTEGINPVPAPTSELTRGVEAVAEITVYSATKQDKFPAPGELYEEGKHCGKVQDPEFEDVGGFSVQKAHASLYEQIWLNYGHIATSQVLPDSYYYSKVVVASEFMTFVVDMNRYPLEEITSDLIDSWEKNVRVAEKLEFNIGWLRERLEDIKIAFAEEKILKEMLAEHEQAKARVVEAEQQLLLAKERLSALETKIAPLLMAKQNFQNKCGGPLLVSNCCANLSPVTAPVEEDGGPLLVSNCCANLSPVKAPVEEDAILNEEPIGNNSSKTVPSKGNSSPAKAPVQGDEILIEVPIGNNSSRTTVPSKGNSSPVKAPVQGEAILIEIPIGNNSSRTVPSKGNSSLVKAPLQKDAGLTEEPTDNKNSKTVPSKGNSSLVKAPLQKDAVLTEEPTDNKNSKTVSSRGTAKKTRLISSLIM